MMCVSINKAEMNNHIKKYEAMKAGISSSFYRIGRFIVKNAIYAGQIVLKRRRDLEDVVDTGDRMLEALPRWALRFPIPPGIGVDLRGLHFPSPLTLASFKDNLKVIERWMMLGLGGATIKTVMCEKRKGNERPRIQELSDGGFLNAMGLPCPGIDAVITDLEKCLEKGTLFSHNRPIGISIGGSTGEEYKRNFDSLQRLLGRAGRPHYYEINISCPNTPDGQNLMKNPGLLKEVMSHMRAGTTSFIFVKLSHDMKDEDILIVTDLVKQFEHTGLNLGNTAHRTCEEAGLPREAISIGGGGLSGPSLYVRTLAMTKLVAPTGVPVLSTGGIDSAEKVIELIDNGATLIGMASGVVKDMYCIPLINRALAERAGGR